MSVVGPVRSGSTVDGRERVTTVLTTDGDRELQIDK